MRPDHDDNMTTISADKIASHLERTGWQAFASFVRQLDDSAAAANRRHSSLMGDYCRLVERLERYEPRVNERPFDPTPPSEASD